MKLGFFVFFLILAGVLVAVSVAPRLDPLCVTQMALHAGQDDRAGWSCLHYAAARGDTRVAAHMIGDGADINSRTTRGETPLLLAAKHGALDMVGYLIRHGAELEARDGANGFTALHWAARRYHSAVLRRLLVAGARVDARNASGQTPLWQAASQNEHGNSEVAHILVRAGADITAAGNRGNTPLSTAARAGHTPVVTYLLDQGADPGQANARGATALYQAVAGNHVDTARVLLSRGADANIIADGRTPLQIALQQDHLQMANLLHAGGATGYVKYAARARLAQGRELLANGDTARAIDALSAAIALQPDDARAYYDRGRAFARQNALRAARADLAQAVLLEPEHEGALAALARVYVETGDYREAVAMLERLLDLTPKNAGALQMLGQSLSRLGEPLRAEQYFRQACELGLASACSH